MSAQAALREMLDKTQVEIALKPVRRIGFTHFCISAFLLVFFVLLFIVYGIKNQSANSDGASITLAFVAPFAMVAIYGMISRYNIPVSPLSIF